jgi:hypothetical protein
MGAAVVTLQGQAGGSTSTSSSSLSVQHVPGADKAAQHGSRWVPWSNSELKHTR